MNIYLLIFVLKITVFLVIYLAFGQSSQLKQFKRILFCRHGGRSPGSYAFNKQFWEKYDYDCLTKRGFEQMKELGQNYKESALINSVGECIYEKMDIVSSTKQKMIMTTIGFITGLCPKNYEQILQRFFKEQFSQYSLDKSEFDRIIISNFSDPFAYNFSIFNKPNDFLFKGNSINVCPLAILGRSWIYSQNDYIMKQAEFQNRPEIDEVIGQMKILNPELKHTKSNRKNFPNIYQMNKFFQIYECNQYEELLQPKLSQRARQYLREVLIYNEYKVYNSLMIQHQLALSEIAKWIINSLYSDVSLSLFSGHDQNLFSIFSILTDQQIFPKFGANLEFSVNEDCVNVYFLGVRMETKLCSSGIDCSRQEVVKYLEKYIVENIEQFCKLP